MRILLLAHGLPPESVGGVEQHVSGLSRALVAAGHHVEIYSRTAARSHAQGELLPDNSGICSVTRVVYRFEDIDSLDGLYRQEVLDRALATFLQTRRFDVAHVHHLSGLSIGALRVLERAGLPTVLTLHDYWLICPRGQMWHHRGELCDTVEPERCAECLGATFPHWLGDGDREEVARLHAHALADLSLPGALVVPSDRAVAPFVALGVDPARIQVVENGVDTVALEGLPLPELDPGTPLRVGFLGTTIPTKGLHILVRALQRLPRGAATLAIHGNDVPYHGEEGYLDRILASLGPDDQVVYHGPYQTDDLPAILSAVDVVAAPALWNEAFGLTVREGLAAGRPAVVSRIGGLQDAVRDGIEGLLVPPGDVEALAGALDKLCRDRELLRRMASACRRRARSHAAMASDLVPIYSRLAKLDPPNYNS